MTEQEFLWYLIKVAIPIIAIATPILRLNSNIVKLNVNLENMREHNGVQDTRLNAHGEQLDNHEVRISVLEKESR